MEKNAKYDIGTHSPEERESFDAARRGSKAVAVGEAADMYGDIQTAEKYGYVERG
jgi:yeast amino acid transporter